MIIRISPETELVMDPLTSVISKEKNEKSNANTAALLKRLAETEHAVDAMVDSLAPDRPLANSWRGREAVHRTSGFLTNMFYGMIAGLIFAGLLLVILFSKGGF
ncbi:MAG: tetrahydromethanopterin S-methyltransferase subunit B [Methanosarcinaceae archaeon]|nr:tetrahydromethanopterin S-methyltransferase subunit B [Methanosarcinaceae archaeon]